LNPEPSEEQKRLFSESQLLRQIVLRQIHEQSERNQAVADLEKELARLQVQSDSLASSLGILANPPPILKDEENRLFGDPVVRLKEPDAVGSGFSLTAVKTADANGSQVMTTGGEEALGEEARKLEEEASSLLNEGQFAEAEKKYQRIVDVSPGNHFALSSLAFAQIKAGNLRSSCCFLKKFSLKPGDISASVNLSKIHCRQGRFDNAIALLNQVVEADSKNAEAYNFLAFALGKGEAAKAEEALRRSLAINPDYPNANFNLAVMYANSEPPSLQLAKKHYEKAKSLGADPDPVLERRLSEVQPAN
jgi:tetratricopeptide (TPR) repeat protein